MKLSSDQILTIIAFIISITISFFFGYFSFRYEKVQAEKTPIEFIPEINQKVPTIDLDDISNGTVYGQIGEKKIRVRFKDSTIIPDEEGNFEIEIVDRI